VLLCFGALNCCGVLLLLLDTLDYLGLLLWIGSLRSDGLLSRYGALL